MKNYFLFFTTCLFLTTITSYSQSFEEISITNVTTTLSASRSANFVDVNGDGWDDIFFSNGKSGGQNNMLYINNTDGTFTTVNSGAIVTDNSRSVGSSFADADNDGDLDLFVTTWDSGAAGKNYFYRNNGDGSFNYESAIAMGSDLTFSEMATWIDYNNDQYLDLYYTNSLGDLSNRLYMNTQNGNFVEISTSSLTNELKASRSVDWVDYDNDGDSDLFVTNENNATNTLYRNDGFNVEDLEFKYVKVSNLSISQDFKNSAGSSWADINNDGDFDLFVANWDNENNQLFINNNGAFVERTTSIIAAGGGNSFGSSFGDIDNDGDLDLIVCNAFASNQTSNFIYINDGQGNFSQDTTSALALHSGWTFGCAFGDYNNDGWLDVIFANTLNENQANSLFKNTGSGNNWVKFSCTGTNSNTSAIGAILKLKANINGNDIIQTRKIVSSSGYCSQSSYMVHFGLGDASVIDELEIKWPSGLIENFQNIEINDIHTIVEGNSSLNLNEYESVISNNSYPIPAKDNFHLKGKLKQGYTNLEFRLVNMLGQEVMNIANLETAGTKIERTINISSLKTGNYIYKVISNNKILISGKLIKK